jgi:hypothetical protein
MQSQCQTVPINAVAMPNQNPAIYPRSVPLLLDLLPLVLHRLLGNGLLTVSLELLVHPLQLLELLLLDGLLGLEVGAEPALDALHAVRAQHVGALELTAGTAFVERGDILQALAGHLPVSLLPI